MANNFDNLFEQLLNALQTAEKRHRAVRDCASDNSDWTTYDSEGELISNIIKWRRNLEPLRMEIASSGVVADEDALITPAITSGKPIPSDNDNTIIVVDDEEIKVGKYIRTKLRELSKSDFRFSSEQIQQLCNTKWSREVFTYPPLLPFAKIVNTKHDISEQTKDENGKNCYWNEVFTFGDVSLLIISQWYAKDKESFDKWYESLLPAKTTVEVDTLDFTIVHPPVRTKSVLIHAKQQFNGDNIVEVSDSFVPVLSFPDKNISICAKLISEKEQVSFRAEINGFPYTEKNISIDYLKEIALLERHERIHRVAVPESVNTCKQMMFMAWIDPLEANLQEESYEIFQPESESTTPRIKPTKITLLGKEYPVRAWNEVFIKVCEVMLLHKPYIMAAIDRDVELNTERRIYFSYIQSDIKVNGKRLSNGLWVETNMNNQKILKRSRRLLEKCGFSPDEIKVKTEEVL